jgi:hypothetical protein
MIFFLSLANDKKKTRLKFARRRSSIQSALQSMATTVLESLSPASPQPTRRVHPIIVRQCARSSSENEHLETNDITPTANC